MNDKTMRYCPLCACKQPRSNGWVHRIIFGIRTWVCPGHGDRV